LRLSGIIVIAMLLMAAGCDFPGKPDPANRPVLPDKVLDFQQLFATNCAGCHGAAGNLGPAPPLNDPLFAAIVPDEELLRVIRGGRTGTPMPAFARENGGSLTDAQVKVLAEGIKSHWKTESPLLENSPPYALAMQDGVRRMSDSVERGLKVFQQACACCHGPNGAGNEQDGVVGNVINAPSFLALISDQALRRIIITGRPDLGMPNFAEGDGRPPDFQPLTTAEIDDLVSLLASWRTTSTVANAEQR
jgi:cytochrome c oxidase cbb3-type subunit III